MISVDASFIATRKGTVKMNKRKTKICATALSLLVLGSTLSPSVGAITYSPDRAISKSSAVIDEFYSDYDTDLYAYQNRLGVKTVVNKSIWSYPRRDVTVLGKAASVKGMVISDTLYIPFRAAASALGASYSYSSSTKTATMTASGLTLTASSGCYVTYANGRALFSIMPAVIMNDGRLYIPADIFAKATGLALSADSDSITLSGSYKPLVSADKFYRADEVLWLGRIIHAEAVGEPLLGQIAVGNVVLNRVKSAYYPNTIYGVIFDRKYGVQFSPILNGTIYNTPSYNATLAAKICLDGYDISGGAFFFLRPEHSTSSWIPNSREYSFTIGNHDFYK